MTDAAPVPEPTPPRPFFFRRPHRPGLRTRLLFFFTLSLMIPILAAGTIVLLTMHRARRESLFREQRELSRRIADRAAAHVESTRRGLSALTAQRRFADAQPGQQSAALRDLLETYPDLMEAVLYDATGRGLTRASRRNGRVTWGKDASDRSRREEFQQAAAGRAYVGPVFFTARDRVPQMFLSVPVGGRRGVLLARLGLGNLWDQVAEASNLNSRVFVVDTEGRLLAHPNRERVLNHENWGERALVRPFVKGAGHENALLDVGAGANRSLAVFHRVRGLPWAVFAEMPYRPAFAPVRHMAVGALSAIVLLGAGFLILGFALVEKILHPLRELRDGLQRIGRGDLNHRLDIRTGDELQQVAEALNGMAESLSALETTKRDLTHMIVHDLKSPLSATLGSIDYVLMLAKDTLPPDQKKLLTLGAKSGKDLLRLIQNLLDVAKMEEGKLQLRRDTFSVLELAGQCLDDLEAQILRENKVISVEVAKDLPKVWADRDLVHRVLANLLTNALKHTPPRTEISIHVGTDADRHNVVISVRDNGEGIPKAFLSRIFEKFSQAEVKRQAHRVGSGLGLTFCKLAVEAHGGRVWVESEPGLGSEFFFSLPLVKPVEDAAPAGVPAETKSVVHA